MLAPPPSGSGSQGLGRLGRQCVSVVRKRQCGEKAGGQADVCPSGAADQGHANDDVLAWR